MDSSSTGGGGLALFWHEGIAGNAQEGPGPISAGPISKSINANQPLTLEGIPAVAGLLPVQPPAKVPAATAAPAVFPRSKVDREDL